ncbi:MAG: hypothetical protein ACRDV9_12490 [Acidimicrobiia bacterium]
MLDRDDVRRHRRRTEAGIDVGVTTVKAEEPSGANGGKRPSTRGQRFPPEVLTPEEVRRLIGATSTRAPSGIRNRAPSGLTRLIGFQPCVGRE